MRWLRLFVLLRRAFQKHFIVLTHVKILKFLSDEAEIWYYMGGTPHFFFKNFYKAGGYGIQEWFDLLASKK